MTSYVTDVAAAPAAVALAHFEARLTFEADCWDVHDALSRGLQDFILLDVRGPDAYEKAHIPGAINLPYGKIIERKLCDWPKDILFVVYCAGPHCNAANKAAVRLARLGRPVKELIGGMAGWADEGFAFASGAEPGGLSAVA